MENFKIGRISRRDLLKLGGASIVTAPFANVPGVVSLAAAQEKPVPGAAPAIAVLSANDPLSKTAILQAKQFPIGRETISLDLDVKGGVIGTVKEFDHPQNVAKQLGRKTSVIESAMLPLLPGSKSVRAIQNALTAYKLPKIIVEKSRFFAITMRRRTTDAVDRLEISKQFPTTSAVTAIISISADGNTAYMLSPTFKRGKKKVIRPPVLIGHLKQLPTGSSTPPPESANPPDASQEEFDFAGCFLKCAAQTYLITGSLLALLGASCATSIAGLPVTAGWSAILAIPSCVGVLFLLAAPAALCAGVCGVDAVV